MFTGCQISHYSHDHERVVNAKPASVQQLITNTDTYHEKDVVVTGTVTSVGGIFLDAIFVRKFVLTTAEGQSITIFVPDSEAVPNEGRHLLVYGSFEQCNYLGKIGLESAIWEFYRVVNVEEDTRNKKAEEARS